MNEKEKVESEVEKEGKVLEELKHQNNKNQNGEKYDFKITANFFYAVE